MLLAEMKLPRDAEIGQTEYRVRQRNLGFRWKIHQQQMKQRIRGAGEEGCLRWMRGTIDIDDMRSLADGLEEEVQTGSAL